MGFFDKAKAALGLGSQKDGPPAGEDASAHPPKPTGKRDKSGRPPLRDVPKAEPGGSLEDVFALRDAGHLEEARRTLASLDRGKGLRTVLRAAAALEAGDEDELAPLLPAVRAAEPPWSLPLQIAAGLEVEPAPGEHRQTSGERAALVELARARGAPGWALAWTRASSSDEEERRRGMVELLFADAALARTVAARDWKIEHAHEDREAVERYASFAHGRDAIRRFGAAKVRAVFARATG